MRSYFMNGIKYIRVYNPDTCRFFTQPVPRVGSNFFTSELNILGDFTVNLISQEESLENYQSILKPMERLKQKRSMISIRGVER